MKRTIVLLSAVLLLISVLTVGCGNKRPALEGIAINEKVEYGFRSSYPSYRAVRTDLCEMLDLHETADGKKVYSMGTMHSIYLFRDVEYSLADLLDTIAMIDPDIVLIEAHDEYYQQYGAVDGPIEMNVACSYGESRNIPVKGIDYWLLDNDIFRKQNSTDDERDNRMFYNIYDAVEDAPKGSTVFVIYGGEHFYNEIPRMEMAGWKPVEIDAAGFYNHAERSSYVYPDRLDDVLTNTATFFRDICPELAKELITDEEVLEQYVADSINSAEMLEQLVKWVEDGNVY